MYRGPLRDEPLAIELHNTIYAADGGRHDGLAEPGWLDALGDRLPAGGAGRGPTRAELAALRDAVRATLHAALEGTPHDPEVLAALNAACARAPQSPVAVWHRGQDPTAGVDHHGASRADIVLAALAADAIALVTGPDRTRLGACHAPGCVLMFVKSHPRREWCSNACGNRARQARHYRRITARP
ncbi:MAG TPA: CGNR zinc finger domain-containing protein [Solirubrobacteraceae bacterium]|nr:CGNR zinc finger domain-containing protein [Solirubrobacteraceae bacterium]